MNVQLLDEKGVASMPEVELVVGDVIPAQKLALELFEPDPAQSRQQFTRLAVCASLVRMTVGGLCMFMGQLTMFVSRSCVLLGFFVVA